MNFMCATHGAVLLEWECTLAVLLLFKLIVQFVELSNIAKSTTLFAL